MAHPRKLRTKNTGILWTAERRKQYKRDWNKQHRERIYVFEKQYRKHNYVVAAAFYRGVFKRYGVSREQYDTMFANQNGCCAICKRPQKDFKKRFGVDHNHRTNQVRALLCGPCNTGIGLFRDHPEILQRAVEYLQTHSGGQPDVQLVEMPILHAVELDTKLS